MPFAYVYTLPPVFNTISIYPSFKYEIIDQKVFYLTFKKVPKGAKCLFKIGQCHLLVKQYYINAFKSGMVESVTGIFEFPIGKLQEFIVELKVIKGHCIKKCLDDKIINIRNDKRMNKIMSCLPLLSEHCIDDEYFSELIHRYLVNNDIIKLHVYYHRCRKNRGISKHGRIGHKPKQWNIDIHNVKKQKCDANWANIKNVELIYELANPLVISELNIPLSFTSEYVQYLHPRLHFPAYRLIQYLDETKQDIDFGITELTFDDRCKIKPGPVANKYLKLFPHLGCQFNESKLLLKHKIKLKMESSVPKTAVKCYKELIYVMFNKDIFELTTGKRIRSGTPVTDLHVGAYVYLCTPKGIAIYTHDLEYVSLYTDDTGLIGAGDTYTVFSSLAHLKIRSANLLSCISANPATYYKAFIHAADNYFIIQDSYSILYFDIFTGMTHSAPFREYYESTLKFDPVKGLFYSMTSDGITILHEDLTPIVNLSDYLSNNCDVYDNKFVTITKPTPEEYEVTMFT